MFRPGVEAYKKSGADYLIAIGGGSSMDTAKAIGIIINNPDFADVVSLEGVADTKNKSVPIFAVPTTAGTAAEVTINYVITDAAKNRKMVCVDPKDIPVVAFVDSEMMSSMPKGSDSSHRNGCTDACNRRIHYSRSMGIIRYVPSQSN